MKNLKRILYSLCMLLLLGVTNACDSEIEGGSDYVPPVLEGTSIKVMSWNMYDQNSSSLDAIGEVIKSVDPDIVGLQEVTLNKNGFNAEERLKEVTGMPYAYFAKALDDSNGVPYGNLILSKTPLTDTKTLPLDFIVNTYYRSMGIVKTTVNNQELYFATTHLDNADNVNRIHQTEQITEYIKDLKGKIILTGDFNGDQSSDAVKMLESDRFTLGCINGYCAPTTTAPQPNKAIDFIFYSDGDFESKEYNAYYKAYTQSDHFPVYATFIFK